MSTRRFAHHRHGWRRPARPMPWIGSGLLAALTLAVLAAGGAADVPDGSPAAVDDVRIVTEDDPPAAIDVLSNDADPDGRPMTIDSVDTTGTHGEVTIDGSGTADRPNIVLILTDDQSFESVTKMPYLRSRTGWDTFSDAFINNATCCPSRATILSGQWSHHTRVESTGGAPRFDDRSTIATWLDAVGYRTGFIGKYHLGSRGPVPPGYVPPGWDEWIEHEVQMDGESSGAYHDYTLTENGTPVSYGSAPEDYSTDVLAAKAVDFIERNGASPFFLTFSPRAPHNPWTPAPRHESAYANEPVVHTASFNEADMSDKPAYWQGLPVRNERDVDATNRKEWATTLAIDDAVKSIVDAITASGVMKDTVIAYMTDNGYAFAAHRHRGKVCAYEECSRTPMLVSYLGRNEGRSFEVVVGNEDLAPTFADLAGATPATPVDGDSFAPMLRTGEAPADWPDEVLLRGFRPPTDTSHPPEFWGLRTREYKYIETVGTDEAELYDLAADPFELENVAARSEYVTVRDELSGRLAEVRTSPPRAVSSGATPTVEAGTGLTYEPDPNYCNDPDPAPQDTFTYTLNGGSTATVSVDVSCDEDDPVAVDDSASIHEDDAATVIDVLANDRDADGGSKAIDSVDTAGTRGEVAITDSGASLTYRPDPNYCNDAPSGAGRGPDDRLAYTLNGGSFATVYVNVSCVDDAPVAAGDAKTMGEDALTNPIKVLANDTDVDGGTKLVESVDSAGTHGAITITGGGTGVDYKPAANYCNRPGLAPLDTFTYTLNGGSTATVSISVNCVDDLPVAVADSASVTEDDPATTIDVLANDADVDGGPKRIRAETDGLRGTVVIAHSGADVTYKPSRDYCNNPDPAPEDTFTYSLNGGSSATVSVAVACVDDPSVAVDDVATVVEDDAATPIDVLANDHDIDGGQRVESLDTTGTVGQVNVTAGGAGVEYQPAPDYCKEPEGANDSFTYTVNGGSTATVSVAVECVDDASVAVDDSVSTIEDEAATAIDVLANDTDSDGGAKRIESVDTTATFGQASVTGDGTGVEYRPVPDYCNWPVLAPLDTFTYTLDGGSTATVHVTVTCVEDPPMAIDDAKALSEDAPVRAIDVLANDTDVDGGTKRIDAVGTTGTLGSVAITGGGRGVRYQPRADYCNYPGIAPLDSFTYTLNGGWTAIVSVTVTCIDDPPVALDDQATVNENDPATTIDVLANDADIDGGPKRITSVDTAGSVGTVAIARSGADLTYKAPANYCNVPDPAPNDTFKYALNRGSTARVSVTVACVPD